VADHLLAGKSILITGASSGIGAAAARLFATEGAGVVLAARTKDAMERIVDEIREAGGTADCVVCDVTHEEDCQAAVDTVVALHGRIDAAFNNAGAVNDVAVPVADLKADDMNWAYEVNVSSVAHCLRYEIRAMLQTGGGSIVNCSSMAGINGIPFAGAYTAAKHALVGLTKSAAAEYADQGVRVNTLAPGLIDTPLWDPALAAAPQFRERLIAAAPIGRLGRAQEVAEAAAWLCSDRASFVTGATLAVDGGLTARSVI
jgi:NAD(P)-dependent dehydrogenase (short-subunit alcohol dehydrogenase family)